MRIPLSDDDCYGCTCCRGDYCFAGTRRFGDQIIDGDCAVGYEGGHREGESLCPCTEPMG